MSPDSALHADGRRVALPAGERGRQADHQLSMILKRLGWVMIALAACGEAKIQTVAAPSGDYRLVAIDSVPLDAWPVPTDCFEVPAASIHQFSGSRWVSHDTARRGPKCPGENVRIDSGHFRVVADTLELFVDDRRIGVDGLILRGLIRGDTVTYWGADLDPGAHVYVRVR
jgi:hypothetical protein